MFNKKIMKEVFEKEFNQEEIRKQVLLSGGKREKKIKNVIWKCSIPICLILISISIALSNQNSSLKTDSIQESNSNTNSNRIIINSSDNDFSESLFALAGNMQDIAGSMQNIAGGMQNKDELLEFSFIQNIKVPERYATSRKIYQYIYEQVLGYHILYYQDGVETIDIFFSDILHSKPRCIQFLLDDLEASSIHNTDVKILKSGDSYLALFQLGDLYFDIEAQNISQEEFILLLESIIG